MVFPDFSNPADYIAAREKRKQFPDHWLVGNVDGFAFSVARKMRKLDQYLMDLYLSPEQISLLHDKIDVALKDMIINYGKIGLDGIMFWEDWGTQLQLLISPEKWREEFRPRFIELCELAHKHDLKVFMHSCGQISALVPDLIEAGVDVLQFEQSMLHGLDNLTAYQKNNKITFRCPVDIQTILQTKDEQLIRRTAGEMVEKLWKGRGGFIAGYYEAPKAIGLEPKWQDIASKEFEKLGKNGLFAT